jgi:dTDP-glucose 4,6-dehydratase
VNAGAEAEPWKGRRVLVTGADGFMGSHLVEALLRRGARVGALVRPRSVTGTSETRLRNLSGLQPQLEAVLAVDVAGPDAAMSIVDFAPAVVFHLAADAYVQRSFDHPSEVVRTNVTGTLNVLEAARRGASIERTVITSSSEVYGPAQTDRIAETHPLEPTSPYAASKVAADRLAMSYHRTFGTKLAVIRPFNTFGPRHVYDVIPKFVARALRGEPLVVYGSGEQTRDFTYVDDMVEGFLLMGWHPAALGEVFNFGRGQDVSIAALAQLVRETMQADVAIEHAPPRAAEVRRLCCDPSRAQRELGWRARVDLEEGLRRHVAWAREVA